MEEKLGLLKNKIRDKFINLSRTDKLLIFIAFVGVVIRVIYICYTAYNVRQHDLISLNDKEGHVAYILYWYNNYKLPDFDPRDLWQFYQPPLHHIIAAIWVKINVFVGFDFVSAVENIQVLIMIYSFITTFICYKIFKEIGIKERGLVIAFTLVCLHPTMILMSGSINNDMLCLMFEMAAILATIKWYKKSSMKNIIIIALCMGLSMMTKTSGALIAPGVAFIFIYRFIKVVIAWKNTKLENKTQVINVIGLIKQFVVFLVIAVTIGMWWSIYTKVRFGMPFGYVPKLSNDLNQYIGAYPIWARFFDFDMVQLKNVFENWGNPCFEHNILIAILKTSLFGEYNFSKSVSYIVQPATILFWSNVILTVLSLIAMLYVCFKKINYVSNTIKIFFGITYITIMGSYIEFCFQYPHTCTMDFRYIVPTIIIGAAAIGLFINDLDKRKNIQSDIISFGICVATLLFAVFGVLTYCVLGLA